ncbi:MAG: flavodoxin family protein [Oscillospiraceae bacterium]|nr:flavodoxin family protein [Oscillospiraceae bacterium]
MQTLIFNGSPKKNGDTQALINAFVSRLHGEVKIISVCNNIAPCNDCRHCWENIGCSIQDDMQDIYAFLSTCDVVALASPIWFSSLSGPLLNMASRLQMLWAAGYFQQKHLLPKEKKGIIMLVGAQPETMDVPAQTALGIMKHMNVRRQSVEIIYSLETNTLPADKDLVALRKCREIAESLNR